MLTTSFHGAAQKRVISSRLSPVVSSVILLLGLLTIEFSVSAEDKNKTAATPSEQNFYQLSPHSMAISPDGRWLAFGRSTSGAGQADLNVSFLIYDIAHGTTVQLGTYNYGSLHFGPRPVWSPNSELLAYYAVQDDILQLRIWDRKRGRFITGGVHVDKAGVAELQKPQWTPDNRFVLCFSNRNPSRLWEEQEGNNYTARLRAELVGQRPGLNGKTLLGTSALAASLKERYGVVSSNKAVGPPRTAKRLVVAMNAGTGASQVLARGGEFVQLQISDDGKTAITGVLDDSGNFLIYALPLPSEESSMRPSINNSTVTGPVNAHGKRLRLLFGGSATESFQNFNLSPTGRYVAYLVEGSGDMVVVDLQTGKKNNLTAKTPALVPDTPEAELRKLVGRFDLPLYSGKFGIAWSDAPVWTRDESALLMRRVIAQPDITAPQRIELWRVGRAEGESRRLVDDTTLSISSWADCVDRSRVNCLAGSDGAVVVLVRKQTAGDDLQASLGYARVNTTNGALHMLRETTEFAGSEFQTASTTGDVASVEESPSHPQELWWVGIAVKSLNVLNPSPLPPVGSAQRLEWISSSGERLFAMLRFPTNVRSNERLPLLLNVYPGRTGLESSRRFISGRYEPLRSPTGYALLTPDMPVQFGSGHVCADLARFATEAVDRAEATGRVDGSRAGVIGISYGGYAVNCIITHTNRFRAAVSEAGPSDLASSHALGGRGEWNVTKSWQWETKDRIVDESPVYHLDKVETPVLFVTGKTDLNNALQEYEMYFGLLALKRPAALVSYDNAGHGDYDRFPEFWQRINEWFQTYLKEH